MKFLMLKNFSTKKFGKFSIGIWGCFNGQGIRAIHFYKGRVDPTKYIKILRDSMIPCLKKIRGRYTRYFQQDNASATLLRKQEHF